MIGDIFTFDRTKKINMPLDAEILSIVVNRHHDSIIFITLQDIDKEVEERSFELVTNSFIRTDVYYKYISTITNPYIINIFEIIDQSKIRNNKLEKLINENEIESEAESEAENRSSFY